MRLDKLLNDRNRQGLTAAQYEKLKSNALLTFMYSQDGWDFSALETFTNPEARKWLNAYWKCQRYEQVNNIESHIWEMELHIVNTPDSGKTGEAKWPEALQKFDTDCIAEAYLMQKFNIKKPRHYAN